MARPERHDVDYFPFYIKDGRTLFLLESKYDSKGTGFFTNLMRFLCGTPDHHFCIKEDTDKLYLYAKCKCDEVSADDMLNIMAKTGKIHAEMYVSAGVIVSEALLNSISDAYRKRKNNIITIDEIVKKYIPSNNNGVSGDNNPVKGGYNPQSKGKEREGKERIFIHPTELDVVMFFKEKGFSVEHARRAFEYYDVAGWKDSEGKPVKNWKQKMIANWLKEENKIPPKMVEHYISTGDRQTDANIKAAKDWLEDDKDG